MSNRINIPWPTPKQLQARTGIDTPVKTVNISVEDYEAARLALMVLIEVEEVIRDESTIIRDGGLHERVKVPISNTCVIEWRTGPEGEAMDLENG
jgi:hypothetical protein